MKRIIMMGPPGAGKGTQGVRLARTLTVPHIASGDLLRRLMAEDGDSELARAVRVIHEGRMVSDEVASAIVFRELGNAAGFVLDGFPRNVAQAELLSKYLTEQREHLDAVLYLHVTEEVVVARIGGRLTCARCGETYHRDHEPPVVAGICDRCGNQLEIRPDDRPDHIRTRLHLYEERTAPLVGWYEAHGLLRHVDADDSQETVFERCLRAIGRGDSAEVEFPK
ncbi:MAG: nucleoside monophosphate kinase [Capsulimonadales bacterium]|nr:nucleoside monophosphate kinase [Capsulimonadales bacterium]